HTGRERPVSFSLPVFDQVCGASGADAACHQRSSSLVCASASIPAAPSPISFPSIAARAQCASPRSRARRLTPQSGSCAGVAAILDEAGGSPDDVVGLAHGTTVATNALLQGPISGLGLIVTAGFRHLLEIARQSVPVGYGNSYFWVKPE